MKQQGIIFDFNGTLFWDSQKHYDAWYEMSKRLRGSPFNDYEMVHCMFGRTNENIMEYAMGRKPTPDEVKKYSLEKELIYLEMCENDKEHTKLAQGVEKFLDYICENNIPHTIATMSEKINVDYYIKVFNLAKWFDIDKIVYSDGTIPGKPEPDIYLIAAKNIGIEPKNCIVFEDAISGIKAAESAGIGKIIAVASKEPVSFYKTIDCISNIITNFNDFKNLI
ncbi:HAD family phosphatase [bacterium]|nr:HAD family phosphatase [bacterium]